MFARYLFKPNSCALIAKILSTFHAIQMTSKQTARVVKSEHQFEQVVIMAKNLTQSVLKI